MEPAGPLPRLPEWLSLPGTTLPCPMVSSTALPDTRLVLGPALATGSELPCCAGLCCTAGGSSAGKALSADVLRCMVCRGDFA